MFYDLLFQIFGWFFESFNDTLENFDDLKNKQKSV